MKTSSIWTMNRWKTPKPWYFSFPLEMSSKNWQRSWKRFTRRSCSAAVTYRSNSRREIMIFRMNFETSNRNIDGERISYLIRHCLRLMYTSHDAPSFEVFETLLNLMEERGEGEAYGGVLTQSPSSHDHVCTWTLGKRWWSAFHWN